MPKIKMPFGPPPAGLQQRLPDWQMRLAHLVNSRRRDSYEYGVYDCWTFASMAVHAVTGVTLLPGVELPKGWLGAARFLIKHDLANVEELAIAALGVLPGDPDLSKPGDLVLVKLNKEDHLAVRVGDSAVMPTADGLNLVDRTPYWGSPISSWEASWAIGWDPSAEIPSA